MGSSVYIKTELEESRYDPDTGTLYCNGTYIPRKALDDSIQYLTIVQRQYANKQDPEMRKMFLIYLVAIEGINTLKRDKIK